MNPIMVYLSFLKWVQFLVFSSKAQATPPRNGINFFREDPLIKNSSRKMKVKDKRTLVLTFIFSSMTGI